jgi:hypothetical protein
MPELITYYACRESVPATELIIGEPYSVMLIQSRNGVGISFASYLRHLTMNADGIYCTSWDNGVVVATAEDVYTSITIVDSLEAQAREYVRMGVVDADYFSLDSGNTDGVSPSPEG